MAARSSKPKEEPVEAPEQVEDAPQNGVVILKQEDENGNLRPVIQTLGNVQITEIQFILEAAIKAFRKELGFDG